MGITVRELVTKLTIGGNATDKLAKFGLAMNGVKAGLGILVGAVKVASAATIGLVDDVTQLGDTIAKTSRQVGISAKEFQRLSFAAERSGVPMVNLKKGLQNIERNLRDAALAAGKGKGTGFTAALDEVGLSIKDFEGLNAEEKIGLFGEALSQVADEGRRVALSQKLVGEEAGPRFASLLAEGTGGLKALGDEAERLGLVMDGKALKASEAFQDSMTNLRSVVMGLKTTIGVALIPIVKKGVDGFKDWILANREFIKQNFEKVVKFLSKAFDGLADNLDDIIKGFQDLVGFGRDMLAFFSGLVSTLGGVENTIRLLTAAWVTYKIAAIAATTGLALGPIGILAVGLLAVAAAFSEIETEADRARKARDRFTAGLKEKEPINKKQATLDAAAITRLTRRGQRLPLALLARLASQNSRQTQISIDAAKAQIQVGKKRPSRTRVIGGKFGTIKRGSERFDQLNLLQGAGKGELDLLKEFEAEIAGIRKAAASPGVDTGDSIIDSLPTGGGGGGGGGGGKGGAKKDTDEDLSELLAAAIKSGQLPESAALLASTQPPIIIPITNNTITVEVDATSTFEGVPGENASEFVERAEEVFGDLWGRKMLEAIDELRPQLAR